MSSHGAAEQPAFEDRWQSTVRGRVLGTRGRDVEQQQRQEEEEEDIAYVRRAPSQPARMEAGRAGGRAEPLLIEYPEPAPALPREDGARRSEQPHSALDRSEPRTHARRAPTSMRLRTPRAGTKASAAPAASSLCPTARPAAA